MTTPPPGSWFRRLLPRGLLARSVLIIVMPLVIVQAVALQLFYGSHWEVVSRRLASAVAGDIAAATGLMERFPDEADRGWIFASALVNGELVLSYDPAGRLPPPPENMPERDLARAIAEQVHMPVIISHADSRTVRIALQLRSGVLTAEVPRKRLFTGTVYLFWLWLIGSSALLFGIAALFMRNQIKPIRRLAAAAEAFGMGREVGPIKPEGAVEVRQAASAFNQMQARVRRFLAQRTEMLAGVSHDLRTPLTRMRLALAMMPGRVADPDEIADLTADVVEMERMIDAYLAFARGEGSEQAEPVDLAQLAEEMAARARRDGASVEVTVPAITLKLRPDAMRRALANLIDNARRHGKRIALSAARVTRPGGAAVEIAVDDDGPGIPPARREEAFRPFVRLTAVPGTGSTGGTGLGLAIARDIIRAHGGEIFLEDGPLGGLRARIRLPV
jgi:two-component system osmolarity sensor histidine kinase EnvZ